MVIPDHLTCLLRNLYAGQEATVNTEHGTMDWFQIRKGVCQVCILSPCLFNLYAENIMQNTRLDESHAGIKTCHDLRFLIVESLCYLKWNHQDREFHSFKYCDTENEYHGIWSHHFMPNRWGNNGNSDRLYFLGLQNHYRW